MELAAAILADALEPMNDMRRDLLILALCIALPVAISVQGHASQASAIAQPQVTAAPATVQIAEKVHRHGVPNLGRVTERLYRGGQPEGEGYDALKELGVNIVVNLRDSWRDKPRLDEQQQVESRGMRYVAIPWSGHENADHAKIVEFLTLLRQNPDKKVYVHCRRGAERTGVMVATFRMTEHGWTAEQALEEMEAFKFRGFWFRHLKKYVRAYPEQLKTNAALSALLAPAAP